MTSDTPVPAAPVPSDAAAGSAAGQRGGPARRRIWWISATLAWAVLLGTLAYLSVGRDEPTVREQRSLEAAVPVVRRALGDLITAAGPETVVEVTAARVQEGCRLTLFWDGAALEQSVLFRTADPDALLDRIADRLPSRYQAAVRRTDGGQHMLRAEAGEFVGVKGHATGPDTVTVTAATGCRPTGGAAPDSTVRTPVDAEPGRLLAALGATRV
ncbi:MAG TPA: hypothetical protein VF174_01040, partial [Micromonosporaceae bacterium]